MTVDVVGAVNESGEAIGDGIVDRDVSNGRLSAKGFENHQHLHFYKLRHRYFVYIDQIKNACFNNVHFTTSLSTPAAVGKVLTRVCRATF